jgi:L-lysine exporter family protein LysE/ArgO
MSVLLAGFLMGLSLIVAIGAQNAYVLRIGLARTHTITVVAICAISDVVLIGLGVGGLGRVFLAWPPLLTIFKWVGVAYLGYFALASLRRALRRNSLESSGAGVSSRARVVLTTLSLTFLNPHVYLDTVLLLGSIGNQYADRRWWFALGACMASLFWFSSLGFGAKFASGLMAKPLTWRVLDSSIALVMLGTAIKLATLHLSR